MVLEKGLRAKFDQVPEARAALKEASDEELSRHFTPGPIWDMLRGKESEGFQTLFRTNAASGPVSSFCLLSELPKDILGVRQPKKQNF